MKPSTLPLWDTAEERTLVPSATQRATGWIWTGSKFEKPKGETLNYWMNNVYKWLKYFDEEVVPSSPIATYEEYTATGGETFITTANNTNLQVYKNGTFLIEDTDYTINVDGVTVDLTVALNVSDFVQWYDLRKLSNTFLDKNINALTVKTTPIDTDNLVIQETGGLLKKLSWSNLKATLLTYFDTLYSRTSAIFGIGQTSQDVTGSRSSGVTYTNTTGKPIEVCVVSIASSGGGFSQIEAYRNGSKICDEYNQGDGITSRGTITFTVPNGFTYQINAVTGSILLWTELR